jgi:alpha/beta superfamily hydrolase
VGVSAASRGAGSTKTVMDVTHELESPALQPLFLDQRSDQLYGVLHRAEGKARGTVLMAGPFAAERERALNVMVMWCQRAAQAGFDSFYFDYRGIGESSGRFEDQTFDSWLEDLTTCAAWLRDRQPHAPLFLTGIRLGAVLAAQAFKNGVGSGLLMWGPPRSARDMLWDVLRRILAADFVQASGAPKKTREDYARMLEGGAHVNVDGYFWSPDLWRSTERYPLALPDQTERRPWLNIELRPVPRGAAIEVVETLTPIPGSNHLAIRSDKFWDVMTTTPVCKTLFESSVAWLERATAE